MIVQNSKKLRICGGGAAVGWMVLAKFGCIPDEGGGEPSAAV